MYPLDYNWGMLLFPSVKPARLAITRAACPLGARGFTLLEWVIALTLLATLVAIAVPAYTSYIDQAHITQAKTDIRTLEQTIARYQVNHGELPDSLNDIGAAGFRDPWGNIYRYLRIDGGGLKSKGALRKDRFLVPLNSDYDLYSMGKDGDSKPPLTANVSRDDIIRANNGAFVGLATDY
jgi:general secretion pathway protein G